MRAIFLSAVLAATVVFSQGQASAEADDSAEKSSIEGRVFFGDLIAAPELVVDLFTATESGDRVAWLGDTKTDHRGRYAFAVDPGCYVLTYLAPTADGFRSHPDPYAETWICIGADETAEISNVVLTARSPDGGQLLGNITYGDGSPAAGIVVDLFDADESGEPSQTWLGDTRTDDEGNYSFDVGRGCFGVVLIAPDGREFASTAQQWRPYATCLNVGLDAEIRGPGPSGNATIGGTITLDDGPASGVVVDLFSANADGSRATWLGDAATNDDGSYRFGVKPGCYVLVVIAPTGTAFVNDGVFNQVAVCVGDKAAATVDAQLRKLGDPCTIRGELVTSSLTGSVCDALMILFDATDGPNWIDNGGWGSSTDPCTWSGLRCAGGALVEVDLVRNGLVGPIPAELGRLGDLLGLNLSFNRLSGPIPPELSQLSGLAFLRLGGNELTGQIPPELGRLPVFDFQISENQLSGPIPAELGQLSDVRIMAMADNLLTGPIPAELGRLTTLESLTVANNQLSGDITAAMTGLRAAGTIQSLFLSDGAGGNNCFTITDPTLADWTAALDPTWAECDHALAPDDIGDSVSTLATSVL